VLFASLFAVSDPPNAWIFEFPFGASLTPPRDESSVLATIRRAFRTRFPPSEINNSETTTERAVKPEGGRGSPVATARALESVVRCLRVTVVVFGLNISVPRSRDNENAR